MRVFSVSFMGGVWTVGYWCTLINYWNLLKIIFLTMDYPPKYDEVQGASAPTIGKWKGFDSNKVINIHIASWTNPFL